ncbi:hypothetical protein Q5425_28055 [Amycolatopsis sp. A133]|nr:hypothetical protein [Amycolatopsis sp. A133]MDQ7807608.1 hypothetical protein [Amycolatopsis sp. A133]
MEALDAVASQAEGFGEQCHGIALWFPGFASFEIADGADTQSRAIGQFLLCETGLHTKGADQAGELSITPISGAPERWIHVTISDVRV